jgi:hypothetical protein
VTKRQRGKQFTAVDNRFFFHLFRYLTGYSMEVYVYLCCYAREREEFGAEKSDPKITDLMEQAGIGNKAISRALEQLERYGFIVKRRTQGGNVYRLPPYEEVESGCYAAIERGDSGIASVSERDTEHVEETHPIVSNEHDETCGIDTREMVKGNVGSVQGKDASIREELEDLEDSDLPHVASLISLSPESNLAGETPNVLAAPTASTSTRSEPAGVPQGQPLPSPVDPSARRRSAVTLDPERARAFHAITLKGGICSTTEAPVVIVPTPPIDVLVPPEKRLTEMQRYFKYWCETLGLDPATMIADVRNRMGKTFRAMAKDVVAPEELPDLLAHHRRTRSYFYRDGALPMPWQVSEVISEWRAQQGKPIEETRPYDPDRARRLAEIEKMERAVEATLAII